MDVELVVLVLLVVLLVLLLILVLVMLEVVLSFVSLMSDAFPVEVLSLCTDVVVNLGPSRQLPWNGWFCKF